MASCGACGEGRASRAYVQNGGADGDWVLKEYNGGYATTALSESAAMARLCPSTRGPYIHEGLLRLDDCPPGSCARGTSVGQQVEVCCVMPCCTRRGFEPGSRPAARLHALPAPPPAPRPAAGARRGARRATRSRAAARRGGWGMGREGSGDAGTAVSRRAFLKKYTCSTVRPYPSYGFKAVAPVRSRPPPRRPLYCTRAATPPLSPRAAPPPRRGRAPPPSAAASRRSRSSPPPPTRPSRAAPAPSPRAPRRRRRAARPGT